MNASLRIVLVAGIALTVGLVRADSKPSSDEQADSVQTIRRLKQELAVAQKERDELQHTVAELRRRLKPFEDQRLEQLLKFPPASDWNSDRVRVRILPPRR